MPERVVVVGAGGFGRETLDVLEAVRTAGSDVELLGVVDSGPSEINLERLVNRHVAFLGSEEDWLASASGEERYIIAIGDPRIRRDAAERFAAAGHAPISIVHPRAVLGSQVVIGEGAVVAAGVQVSTNVAIGDHVHLNPGCIIGHDATLRSCVSVNPGAIVSGNVVVESRVLIGAGAVVLQGLRIGEDVTIGAAACVTRDVAARSVVKGIPAR